VELAATPLEGMQGLAAVLEGGAADADSIYSWHDLSPSARPFGRGVLLRGRFARPEAAPAPRARARPISAARRGAWRPALLNGATCALSNALLFRSLRGRARRTAALDEALFPLAGRASLYFDLYGARGFHEYQVLGPAPRFDGFAAELERRVREERMPVSLASAKYFGGRQEFLRFDGPGVAFALDLPRSAASAHWLRLLDELTLACGGLPNIIKDSRLPREVMQRAFAQCEGFRRALLAFDARRLYRSELSERLGL
jgi:decaprenylphospho-beta-D-ribofuranose 2-oxidase